MSEVRNQPAPAIVRGGPGKSEVRGQIGVFTIPPAFLPSAFCLLLSGSCLLTSVFCPLVQAEELKIGYVDVAKVFDEYQRTKESEQLLEQKGKQKQAELEGRSNELKKLRQGLELLNDQAREPKAREVEEKSDEFQRLKERSARDLLRERNQVGREILTDIEQTVAEYAKAKGFSVILDQRSLVYGEAVYDLTDEVLRFLNDRYATKKR